VGAQPGRGWPGGGGVKEASLRQHEIAHAVLNGPACLV